MGRWTAPDPTGIADGVNLYTYVNDRSTSLVDKTGHQGTTPDDSNKPQDLAAVKNKVEKTIAAATDVINQIEKEDAPLRQEQGNLIVSLRDLQGPEKKAERDKVQQKIDANAVKLKESAGRIEKQQTIIAESKQTLKKITEAEAQAEKDKRDPVTPGIDTQIGGSGVGIGTKHFKGSVDFYQITLLPRNLELIPLYYHNGLDIAVLKEPGVQYSAQQQPEDTGKGWETHNTVAATVDLFNLSYDPKGIEVAVTGSGGYDFTGGNVAITGVLGLKYTLKENASDTDLRSLWYEQGTTLWRGRPRGRRRGGNGGIFRCQRLLRRRPTD